MTKADLRAAMKAALSKVDRVRESTAIERRLEGVLPAAGIILAFEPLRDEPDISSLIEKLKAEDRLALVAGDRSDPVLDPAGAVPVLALVPGRAFDRAGRRLGRGGGTFDRILAALACRKLGVCFDCQLLEEIPSEPHDANVDEVVTASTHIQSITRPR